MNWRQISTDPDRYYIFLPGFLYGIIIKTPLTQKKGFWLGMDVLFFSNQTSFFHNTVWCTDTILHNNATTTNTHNHRHTHSPNNTTSKTNTPSPQTLSHAYVPNPGLHRKCASNALFSVSGLPIIRAKHKSHVNKPTHKNIDMGLRTIDTYKKYQLHKIHHLAPPTHTNKVTPHRIKPTLDKHKKQPSTLNFHKQYYVIRHN